MIQEIGSASEREHHPLPAVHPVVLAEPRQPSAWQKVRGRVAVAGLALSLVASAAYESTQPNDFPDGAAPGCQPDYDVHQAATMAELRADVAATEFALGQQEYDIVRTHVDSATTHEQINTAMDLVLNPHNMSYVHNTYFRLFVADQVVPQAIAQARYREADLATAKQDAMQFLHTFKNIPRAWIDQLDKKVILNNVQDFSDIMHRGNNGMWAEDIPRAQNDPYDMAMTVNTRYPDSFRTLLIQQLAQKCGLDVSQDDIRNLDLGGPVAAMLRGLTPGLDSVWQYAAADHGQMILSDRANQQSATVDCQGTNKDMKWIEVTVPSSDQPNTSQTIRVAMQIGQGTVSYEYGYDVHANWSRSQKQQLEEMVMQATALQVGTHMQPTQGRTRAIRFGNAALSCRSFAPARSKSKG